MEKLFQLLYLSTYQKITRNITMNKFIFFTFNNFSTDDGGTVRMYGILNALANKGEDILLISNSPRNNIKFHNSIKHKSLNLTITDTKKKFFQFSLALFPNFINKLLFNKYLKEIQKEISTELKKEIIFFEYIDNSFGYFLKRNNLLPNYINDIHGIAPLEFQNNRTKGVKKIYNLLRYKVSLLLDFKVMSEAKKIIVVSNSMKEYFLKKYPFLSNKIMVIPDGVSQEFCSQKIDKTLLSSLTKQYKNDNKKIIFFAGDFKDLGGILDLLNAFISLSQTRNDIKLFLIGNGEHFTKAKTITKNTNLEHLIYFKGRVPYSKLKTYQQLADVIVCPDKAHPYSNIVPHIKYFDSLVSNKIVINGNFKSTREINKEEKFSIDFEPSNITDLVKKIDFVLNNQQELEKKYKNNQNNICNKYTYNNFVKI